MLDDAPDAHTAVLRGENARCTDGVELALDRVRHLVADAFLDL
jgi:hypothetical protein